MQTLLCPNCGKKLEKDDGDSCVAEVYTSNLGVGQNTEIVTTCPHCSETVFIEIHVNKIFFRGAFDPFRLGDQR